MISFKKCLQLVLLGAAMIVKMVYAGDLPNHRFIHASGEVVRAYSADMGEINFELTELHPAPEKCLELMLRDSEDVFKLLRELGISDDDILAANIKRFISPVEYLDTPENQKKYRLMRSFHVVVRDLQQWDQLIKGLTRNPSLGNFTVNFGRSDLSQVQAEMLNLALEDAKIQAKNMSNMLGVKLDVVTGVSQTSLTAVASALGLGGTPPVRDRSPKMTLIPRDFSVPAQLRFSMSVNVMYRIK
ncbi:SIMPL domain-containing protein [Undibacterium cyanobacteriorum]|uniref:SIMPL domain-containing protein n=1 Tax=Undibacterium cyanobacteriorum TaxID=3073561 RepID=A0ABY9RE94_9BURK|nr:SIMPL domain-containing protein [Undibacterium sp. 20NA77.5]WMW78984.1 SIMPL domain-containing protein [Undibacterium sp. 20NA77.5]